MKLTAAQTTMAMGIGGSFCSGLLAFVKSGQGGMVKRIYMGRAAEGGATAANLVVRGFEGPEVILSRASSACSMFMPATATLHLFAADLGERLETLTITFKTFPCHVTSHSPASRRSIASTAADVATITIDVSDKVLSHHADRRRRDRRRRYTACRSPSRWLCSATPAIRRRSSTGRTKTRQSWSWPSALSRWPYNKEGPNNNDMACRLHIVLQDRRHIELGENRFRRHHHVAAVAPAARGTQALRSYSRGAADGAADAVE